MVKKKHEQKQSSLPEKLPVLRNNLNNKRINTRTRVNKHIGIFIYVLSIQQGIIYFLPTLRQRFQSNKKKNRTKKNNNITNRK